MQKLASSLQYIELYLLYFSFFFFCLWSTKVYFSSSIVRHSKIRDRQTILFVTYESLHLDICSRMKIFIQPL